MEPLTTIAAWLRCARERRFALAAFNAVNMETAQAIVQAAELERAPVILQFSHRAARYASLPTIAAIGRHLRAEATVPVFLHFDHAKNADAAIAALDLGFESVMLEGADLEFEVNIAATARVVAAARAVGAAVEAELESVAKPGRSLAKAPLPPGAVAEFATRTRCDALVVNLGSHHKELRRETSLDLNHLAFVASQTRTPLVLHGGSGVRPEDLAKAIEIGIAKVNVATSLTHAFTRAVRESLAKPGSDDPRIYLEAGRTAMMVAARGRLSEIGASGLAAMADAQPADSDVPRRTA